MNLKGLLALCFLGSASVISTNALPITSLYNTGVDGTRTVLANGTIGDPHYQLVSVPSGSTAIRVITSDGYPIPPYFGDNASSRWIGPNNDSDLKSPSGNYTYRTTFDLTGFDAATASITGGWSTDNNGVRIVLNGTTFSFTTAFNQFELGFAPFTLSQGFVSGLNTLDFVVFNGGTSVNPTALRVEMTGTANSARVPEGGSVLVLLGTALTVVAGIRRKVG